MGRSIEELARVRFTDQWHAKMPHILGEERKGGREEGRKRGREEERKGDSEFVVSVNSKLGLVG